MSFMHPLIPDNILGSRCYYYLSLTGREKVDLGTESTYTTEWFDLKETAWSCSHEQLWIKLLMKSKEIVALDF